jgi:hypothetical protein
MDPGRFRWIGQLVGALGDSFEGVAGLGFDLVKFVRLGQLLPISIHSLTAAPFSPRCQRSDFWSNSSRRRPSDFFGVEQNLGVDAVVVCPDRLAVTLSEWRPTRSVRRSTSCLVSANARCLVAVDIV